MPRIPRKRSAQRRVDYVTASATGPITKTFVGSAASRFTDALLARPSRLVIPERKSRGGDNHDEHQCQWDDNEARASSIPSEDRSPTEKEDFPVIIRKRNKPSERQALARNWRAAEKNIVSLLLGERVQCHCLHRESVDVRFVGLEGRCRQSEFLEDLC